MGASARSIPSRRFDRVVKSGAPELVLVSGYSGIGKSSVVNELHARWRPRGLSHRAVRAVQRDTRIRRSLRLFRAHTTYARQERGELSRSREHLWKRWPERAADGRRCAELKLILGDQPPSRTTPQDSPAPLPLGSALSRVFARGNRWRCSSTICTGSMRRRLLLEHV